MKKKAKLSILGLAISSMVLAGCKGNEEEPKPENPQQQEPGKTNTDVSPTETPTETVYEDKTVVKSVPADFQIPATIEDKVTGITLDKQCVSLYYSDKKDNTAFNEDVTIKATVYPKRPGKRDITWTSENPEIATVDENGKITAVSQGITTVTVANGDGSVKASTRVVVSNLKDQKLQFCKDRLEEIMAAQASEGFAVPESYYCFETFDNTITKNGVLDSRTYYLESLTSSRKNAYLDLSMDTQEFRVQDGSAVPSKTHYTFYTTDQYETFLFKSSGKVKNYMSVNQSNFMGQGKIEALKSVCDQFFVSGAKILTGVEEDIYANKVAEYLTTTTHNRHYAYFEDVPGQLTFDLNEAGNDIADAADESGHGIPIGTQFRIEFYIRYLFENNMLSAEHFEQTMTYTLNGDNYVNKYTIDYTYRTNVDLVYPNKDNYQKVDSAFDL
ncbi:MAG: Ig-like domain-containing protein [Bacilli bacterium]|nr:Ig-like domain-containing protein [Bacilli bacterium]